MGWFQTWQKLTFLGVFRAAAQNWWVTADGGVIYYTAILLELWPTALGTDGGVRTPDGQILHWSVEHGRESRLRRRRAGHRSNFYWGDVPAHSMEGGMVDAPLPLAVPAPRNVRTRAIEVLLDSQRSVTKPSHRPGVSAARKCRP